MAALAKAVFAPREGLKEEGDSEKAELVVASTQTRAANFILR